MPLTRLDNLYSSKTGKYLYVSPDDFNATDELDNRGNSPLRPFKTIQRAFIEVSRYSYLPGKDNDRFDQFSIMLMPGNHYIDNRPGLVEAANPEVRYFDAANLIEANKQAIIDRGAADIAIHHPDFYYPNDNQTEDYSRFKDAFRLTQLNRQEIINNSWNATITQYPAHGAYQEKCKRDLGLFLDAISLDVAQADGNQYTRKFLQTFFNESGQSWLTGSLQGEESEAKYAFEKARDNTFLAIANQLSAQDLTITADNAPGSPYGQTKQQWTPSDATYTPADGKLVLEITSHGLSIGDHINIDSGSLVFTCDQDNNTSNHSYPRLNDPAAGRYLEITAVTTNTIEVNVGSTPIVNYTPTNAEYSPLSGDLILDIGTHTLSKGETVKLAADGLTFTCGMDANATNHTYPRPSDPAYDAALPIISVGTTYTPTSNTTYNPNTGNLTVDIGGHGFLEGDFVKLDDGAVTFKCAKDNYATDHAYPRATDPASGQWLAISNVTATTFDINVGISPDIAYNVSDASYVPTTGMLTIDIGNHSFSGPTTKTAEGATYNPTTGIVEVTIQDHGYIDGDRIKIEDDSLVFTCDMDGDNSNHAYPRSTDPVSGQFLPISNITADTFQVNVGASPIVKYTPTDATYNPANGDLELTIGNHDLKAGTNLKIAQDSIKFTCEMDGNTAVKSYPRATDPVSHEPINITSVGSDDMTVESAIYSPGTGDLVIIIQNHNLQTGDKVMITDGSITFSCQRDSNGSNHPYPRATDPVSGQWLTVTGIDNNSFNVNVGISSDVSSHSFVSATTGGLKKQNGKVTVNVGSSPIVNYTPTGANFTPSTGDLVLDIGQHDLLVGTSIKLADESIIFTCAADNNQTQHAYPRANGQGGATADDPSYNTAITITDVGTTSHQPEIGTAYNPVTGDLTVKITAHNFATGDRVSFDADALKFTCEKDNNVTEHDYPRVTDPVVGRWLPISDVTTDTFKVNVGISYNTSVHTFVSAVAGSLKRQTGMITVNVGTSSDTSAHSFVTANSGAVISGGNYTHTFDSAVADAVETGGGYTHEFVSATTNGIVKAGDSIKIGANTINFTCGFDGHQSQHSYPRTSDPAYETLLPVVSTTPTGVTVDIGISPDTSQHIFVGADAGAVTAGGNYNHVFESAVPNSLTKQDGKITINVGASPAVSHNVSGATFDPTTGDLELTIGAHSLATGTSIRLLNESISFTCLLDNDQTQHAYPRSTDPAYDTSVSIIGVTGTTITVNVGTSSDTSTHTFASALAGAVVSGGNYTHTFASATPGVLITGGNYGHTFISSTDNSVTFADNQNNRENVNACADIQSFIANLTALVTQTITDGNLNNLPVEAVSAQIPAGEEKCKRDIGYFVDAVVSDLRNGGNSNTISTTKTYFDRDGAPIVAGLSGEIAESVTAFNGARDQMTKAVSNQLYSKDLVVTQGPAIAGTQGTPIIDYGQSGNPQACSDVQSSIITLTNILTSTISAGNLNNLASVQVTGTVPIFNYNSALEEWQDDSILDLSNPDNVLYKFNSSTGGTIVPRGCSLIGYDLRRTIVRPLYVPDCVDGDQPRSSVFNLTGGCYLWQFTIKDGDLSTNSPLYDAADNVGKVYSKSKDFSQLSVPEYSHHKLTVMTYAGNSELDLYYTKVGKAFAQFQPTIDDGEFDALVQETRIVGPLSDSRTIESIKVDDNAGGSSCTLSVTTKIDHGYFVGQYVAILNSGLSTEINGTWKVTSIDSDNAKLFQYQIPTNAAGLGLVSGATYTASAGQIGSGAVIQAEIDSVESASPYVFNCSIRSTWGICGMWAEGSKVTGFKSMVVAQYTGVSLQKDDRAFIRYDRFNNTWNQASLTDAFATIPYHTKGDAYWKDDWRNFHIRCTDDAFIQAVSVFAVGYHNHFLLESGGDMSITNSNSNFGNTSLHSKGFKGFAFNQDKGGYIDAIVPPKVVNTSATATVKQQYYTLDIEKSNDQSNHTKLFLAGDENVNPADRPAANIGGYRLGAKSGDQIYVNLQAPAAGGKQRYHATLEPSGWTTYTASLSTLKPADFNTAFEIGGDVSDDFNSAQDAATLIERNKSWIASETYGYITGKYPALLTNPAITITKCERDIGYFVDAVVKDLRVGGNINSINAGESYFQGSNLNYINNELAETLDAMDHAKRLMLGAMRNFSLLIKDCTFTQNSSSVVVGDTSGLVPGMKIREYNSSDYTNGYIDTATATPVTSNIPSQNIVIGEVVNATTITLKDNSTGNAYTVSSAGTTTAWLYFENNTRYTSGAQYKDESITVDTQYPECTNIASAVQGYYDTVNLILSGNGSSVTRVEAIIDSSSLSGRATVFTVNTGGGQTDPHGWQTGTPVRIVPKRTGSLDKRLVRLPVGFATNQVYYVIAPGRETYPKTWHAGGSEFDRTNSTKLMLAASKENAAAGIYIFSPETDFIDSGVEVELQQYVLDDKYDLHRYICNVSGTNIESDIPHVFDTPLDSVPVQKIFFATSADASSALPTIAGGGTVATNVYYYPRWQTKTKFSIHATEADARAGVNEIVFTANSGNDFLIYGDKKTSALKYDAQTYQRWYINVKPDSIGGADPDNILTRFHASDFLDGTGNLFTPDTWFERLEDARVPNDRIYRLRYVIPSYLQNVREPLNGYVIKARTDDRRRLKSQKFYLEPFSNGAPLVAEFTNPARPQEQLGLSLTDLDAAGVTDLDNDDLFYDAYANPLQIEFDSKVKVTIQSAKVTQNALGADRLQLTVFDHTVDNASLKNEQFVVIQTTSPQGAGIQADLLNNNETNLVTWTGSSTGTAYVHAYCEDTVSLASYVILKNVTGKLKYDSSVSTTFTQANGTFWTLTGAPDSVGLGKSRSDIDNFLYRVAGANVYTVTPGDKVTTPTGHTYSVAILEDVPEIDDTFYIFNTETIQEVIPNQQEGIYYLTCVRGNISPYPTGAGVGNNFHSYKFSQPVSNLFPLNFKNDPLWFQVQANGSRDTTVLDPPSSVAAAHNYIHGYVTLNDSKYSETKEALEDLLDSDPLVNYQFTNSTSDLESNIIDNRIQAQSGNASIGSENRQISIAGDSVYPLEGRFYVELRRPSIARSGNHTFEYLGFGPGNYSTGFPVRQEVVLSDKQDFYAQAKREDAGIVFYTGLNSNGDLYIGNKKINAITGEETFLEQATLQETSDDADQIGVLVTTFDTAVTFNSKITVEGDSYFNNPVQINVDPSDGEALRVLSLVDGSSDDPTLSRQSFRNNKDGDIVLTKNQVNAAIFALNPRGNLDDPGQVYKIKTHYTGGSPSNATPNQTALVASGGSSFYSLQNITYGSGNIPEAGDILLKGKEVGKSGSWGSIYANYYTEINDSSILKLTANNTTTIEVEWAVGIDNPGLGVQVGNLIRVSNFSNTFVQGVWAITEADQSGVNSNKCKFEVYNLIGGEVWDWASQGAGAKLEISNSSWKELGVIGSEAIRTETNRPGDLKLGVNTIARMAIEAALNGSVSDETDPRANLDVVGTGFISGKILWDGANNNYLNEPSVNRTYFPVTNAFLVGGDSASPDNVATFRVATSDPVTTLSTYQSGGRVGINTSVGLAANRELDRNFVVVGDARITGNTKIEDDLSVDGGDINSTAETFQFINTDTDFFIGLNNAESIILGNSTTQSQTISVGNQVSDSNSHIFRMGAAAGTSILEIHKGTKQAFVDIASATDEVTSNCEIILGGAAANPASSTYIGTYQTKAAGTIEFGAFPGTSETRIFSQAGKVNAFDGTDTTQVTLGLNASKLEIGSLGGDTTVRNSLNILASTTGHSDIKLVGGQKAGIVEIERARFNVPATTHIVGSLDNPNVDFLKYGDTGKVIDTQGVGPWGGDSYLLASGQIAAIDNISPTSSGTWVANTTFSFLSPDGGNGTGALFTVTVDGNGNATIDLITPGQGYIDNDQLTITADKLGNPSGDNLTFRVNGVNASGTLYNLPISQPAVTDFKIGDLLLVERGHASSPDGLNPNGSTLAKNENQNEIIRVEGLTNITNGNDPDGYRLAVSRQVDGTAKRIDHPDGCVIARLDKQVNATYITGFDFDNNGELDPISDLLISDFDVTSLVSDGTDILTINWGNGKTNDDLSIEYGESIAISGTNVTELNGEWIVQSGLSPTGTSCTVKLAGTLATATYLWSGQPTEAEVRIKSASNLLADTANVRIGVAEFGGVLTTADYLLLSDSEITKVVSLVSTEVKSLIVTDGGDPENKTFEVQSLTGNTSIQGNLNVGNGYNKLTVNAQSGNTTIAGTTTIENTLTVNGSVVEQTEYFRLTNGGSNTISLRTTLEVDTATGDLTINGGDINIFGADGTTPRLTFVNSSGDFTSYGSFSALGTGTSTFGGDLVVQGDATVNGGDLTINHNGHKIFSVENDGAVNIAGISNYFTQTGGRKWEYSADAEIIAQPNTNYVVDCSQNTVVKLPQNPLLGDMIRVLDVGGLLTYNLSLVIRAATNIKVQNSSDNTGTAMLTGNTADLTAYNGGELVVQTPYAGFALLYVGNATPDGGTAAPTSKTGWYLIEV